MMVRRIGVRVLTFSLGFGPKILKLTRGDTEYCVSAIPLGGYVKMAGENPEDARTGADDEFLSKSKWQRFQVLIMGPLMNLALAFVVMAIVLYQGAQVAAFDQHPAVIGSFAPNSTAQAAGLMPRDRVVMVDGEPVDTWEDFAIAILPKAKRTVTLTVDRSGQRIEKQVVPAAVGKFEIGDIGILPPMRPEIVSLTPGEPGQQSGLQPADVIVAVGAERGPSRDQIGRASCRERGEVTGAGDPVK